MGPKKVSMFATFFFFLALLFLAFLYFIETFQSDSQKWKWQMVT